MDLMQDASQDCTNLALGEDTCLLNETNDNCSYW